VPPEELEANKPQLEVSQSGNNLIIDWETQPEVFYFMNASPDLSTWVTAKLLKDSAGTGSLSLGTAISADKGFYRLSLEGDPDSARLRADDDGDGIINLLEVEAGWDAFATMTSGDSDLDGIPDYFENFHFGNLDKDADYVAAEGGLTLAESYANAVDPNGVDADGDGYSNAQEIEWGWDPNYDQSRDDPSYGPNADKDGDGLSNLIEATREGTNPDNPNTDGAGPNDGADQVPYAPEISLPRLPESSYALIDLGVATTGTNVKKYVSNQGTVVIESNGSIEVTALGATPITISDPDPKITYSLADFGPNGEVAVRKTTESDIAPLNSGYDRSKSETTLQIYYPDGSPVKEVPVTLPMRFDDAALIATDLHVVLGYDKTYVRFHDDAGLTVMPTNEVRWEETEGSDWLMSDAWQLDLAGPDYTATSPSLILSTVDYYPEIVTQPGYADFRGSFVGSAASFDLYDAFEQSQVVPEDRLLARSRNRQNELRVSNTWTHAATSQSTVPPNNDLDVTVGATGSGEVYSFNSTVIPQGIIGTNHEILGLNNNPEQPMAWMKATTGETSLLIYNPESGGNPASVTNYQPKISGLNNTPITIRKVLDDGQMLADQGLWKNGRVLSDAEVLGPNSEQWTELSLEDASENGTFIISTAKNQTTQQVHSLLLLKMDLDIHRPGTAGRNQVVENVNGNTTVTITYPLPQEIPEDEQQDPTRCPILINNDNDDLDSPFGSGSYPKDNDDDVLYLKDPGENSANPKIYDDDDVVMLTLRKFDAVNTGKIRLTTSKNEDVRFFKYEEAQYTLDAVDIADLEVDLSNPGTTSPLKDLPNEDVSFYLEGINENSDLTVSMIFEDANDNELARQEVHLEIIKPRIIALSAQANGEIPEYETRDANGLLVERGAREEISRLIQGANVVRRDRDWLDEDADVMVPVTFRLGQYFGRDTDTAHIPWNTVSAADTVPANAVKDDIRFYMTNFDDGNGLNIYLVKEVIGAGGFAWRNSGSMVLPVDASNNICAHEWLHAFGGDDLVDANDDNHICIEHHLMVGKGCNQDLIDGPNGSDVRESEKVFFELFSVDE